MSGNATPCQNFCSTCQQPFATKSAHKSHTKASHPSCGRCKAHFESPARLQNHQRETGHLHCIICDLSFSKKKTYKSHCKNSHPSCVVCTRQFNSAEQLQSHQREKSHLYCKECNVVLTTNSSHIAHVRTAGHPSQYHCCDCDREYNSQKSLNNHCCTCDKVTKSERLLNRHFKKQQAHLPLVKKLRAQTDGSAPRKCAECNEEFPSKKALKKHRSVHKPLRRIPCPVGKACMKKFVTPSGLLDHLESGRCRSGMTRAQIHELVWKHDTSRHITSARESAEAGSLLEESSRSPSIVASPGQSDLIGAGQDTIIEDDATSEWSILERAPVQTAPSESGSEWSVLGGVSLQPGISESCSEWSLVSPIYTPMASQASEAGLAQQSGTLFPCNLRCPQCPPKRKPFRNLKALEAHISSAAHAPKIFHCPLAFVLDTSPINKRKQEKRFASLAGLARHLESGACRGGKETFVNAMEYVQDQLRALGLDGVKLLLD